MPFKIDKIYIITYDENILKIWRVVWELASIWLTNIEIINWINKKDIKVVEWNQTWTRIYYKYDWEEYTQKIEWPYWVSRNCACMLSHKIAFNKAKKDWHEVVMMVEDDLLLWYKVKRYLEEVLKNVPNDRDILRLEWNLSNKMWEIEIKNKYWFSNTWVTRSTARMLFNKTAINHINDILNTKPMPTFDWVINKQCHNLKSYASLRSMWIQRPL